MIVGLDPAKLVLIVWSLAVPLLIRVGYLWWAARQHVRSSMPKIEPIEMKTLSDSLPLPTQHISMDRAVLGAAASSSTRSRRNVRLVVISDTHSFERDLTGSRTGGTSQVLPDGDVLIHSGDFATDPRFDGRTVEAAQRSFDTWLAAQPHRHKIVIAGNHDPPGCNWPASGATYAGAGPRSVEVAGVQFGLVPFFREQFKRTKYVVGRPHVRVEKVRHKHFALPRGEVLVSHSPPHGVLDTCGSGEHGGSTYLRGLVQRAAVKPALWLCGHIHEGRGAACVHFSRASIVGEESLPTVVINAANANPGIARKLVHGAVVIDL